MKKSCLFSIATTLLTATSVYALDCATPPTCAELGYTDTVANCDGDSIKCPFDLTVGKCISSGPVVGQIGYFPFGGLEDKRWARCDGRLLHKDVYPELYAVLGYRFGGSGNTFAVPDYLGDYVRVGGRDAGTSYAVRQKEGLPNIYGEFVAVTQDKESTTTSINAFSKMSTASSGLKSGGDSDTWRWKIKFRASDANSIYGASEHVTPVYTPVNAYIYAGKVDASKVSAKDSAAKCAQGNYYYDDGTCSSSYSSSKNLKGIVMTVSKHDIYTSVKYFYGGKSSIARSEAEDACKNKGASLMSISNASFIPNGLTTNPVVAPYAKNTVYWFSDNTYSFYCSMVSLTTTCTNDKGAQTAASGYYWCNKTDHLQ